MRFLAVVLALAAACAHAVPPPAPSPVPTATASPTAPPAPEPKSIVTLSTLGAESVTFKLAALGFDVGGVDLERQTVTVIATSTDVEEMRKALGDDLQVLSSEPVAEAVEARYKRPEDIEPILRAYERKWPKTAKVFSIGKTAGGRDIWALRIGKEGRIPVVIDSMHHARELMTPEVALDIPEWIFSNTKGAAKEYLDKLQIWVVPMLNPDGNHLVWTRDRMQRKNGRGVDPNRNYLADWGRCNGSSPSPSSETYRGPSAGSEAETQAIMALVEKTKPIAYISNHTASEMVLFAPGCAPERVEAKARGFYEGVGKALAAKLVRDSGNGTYAAGTPWQLLYNTSGDAATHAWAAVRALAYVIEWNSTQQGFQPRYDLWRDTTVAKARPGFRFVFDLALKARKVKVAPGGTHPEDVLERKADASGNLFFIPPSALAAAAM